MIRDISHNIYLLHSTIVASLSHENKIYFKCKNIPEVFMKSLEMKLQLVFPDIPWKYERLTDGIIQNHRKRSHVKAFYGEKHIKDSKKSMQWKKFQQNFQYRVQNSIECQIEGSAQAHRVFPLQQQALDFIQSINISGDHNRKEPRLLCFETHNEGTRKFLVTDIDIFWEKYIATPVDQRHVYEIIRENTPCRLYFDIGTFNKNHFMRRYINVDKTEYKKKFNHSIVGEKLVENFVHLVIIQFYVCVSIIPSILQYIC